MYRIPSITTFLFLALIIIITNSNISYAMKSLNIDVMVSWEYGIVICILGRYMDHKKGNRKSQKWSNELLIRIKKDTT